MFVRTTLCAAAAFGLSAFVAAADPMAITTEKAFRDAVVDRPLMLGKNELTINSAGQLTGTIGGEPITASKWIWDRDKFCRVVKTKARDFPSECQTVSIDGDTVTFGGKNSWTIR